jgi:hypothetical protein
VLSSLPVQYDVEISMKYRYTTRQYLPLFIQEFLQKFGVFIIEIFDTVLFETTVFFLFNIQLKVV